MFDRVTSATDTYSAVCFNLRKQLYLNLPPPIQERLHAHEISLTELDQFRTGGSEAALRHKSRLDIGPPE